MPKINFITSNKNKFQEVATKLKSLDIETMHLDMKYAEIQADKIEDVARYSLASLIPSVTGNFFIEDAGLEIDALGGFPGAYSSFVYQTIGWQGILKLLQGKKLRTASFVSIIGLYYESRTKLFRGEIRGKIADEGRGEHGFGFDPIFIPDGSDKTFSEMEIVEKNKYNHRIKALEELFDYLKINS